MWICTILLTLSISARADWSLTNSQFQSQTIQLQSIDDAGIHYFSSDPGKTTIVPWPGVLDITRTDSAAGVSGKYLLYMLSGDKLGGSPGGVVGEKLRWNVPGVGELQFSLEQLEAVVKIGSPAPADMDQNRSDDIVALANGDHTHGIITDVSDQGVSIQAGGATPTLPWDAVTAVLFSPPPKSSAPTGRMFRVRLGDDTSLLASQVTLSGNQLAVSLDGKNSCTLSLDMVQSIEQVNGPVSWLTSRALSENIYHPYFSENFPAHFDQTVDGRNFRDHYKTFHHAIGVHSYSKLSWNLDGAYDTFRTQYAIDDDSPLADVTVRILLDDKVAYEKKNVKAGPPAVVIALPLAGSKKLSLEVDYGPTFATEGRFIWLDPALVKSTGQ